MSEDVGITVLMENSVHGAGLVAEHGLAFLLQSGSDRVLFDTGQSGLLLQNARRLRVDMAQLPSIALSHGHYDHVGGLQAVWQQAPGALLYAHPAALGPHRIRNADGSTRPAGMPDPCREATEQRQRQIRYTPALTELPGGFLLTGEIPRVTDFEDAGGPFVLDEAGLRSDSIPDDQALFVNTWEGVVVVLGCAHAGVINTLKHIRQLTDGRHIHAVLGGMHLLKANRERMDKTVAALRDFGVALLMPAHCTGMAAMVRLWREFPEACSVCAVGSRWVFRR